MKHILTIILICLTAVAASAGYVYVDDKAPNDPAPGNPLISDPAEDGTLAHPFDAIQQAIDAAANNDEVIILPGTYTGNGNRDIDYKGKSITVRSTNPNDPNTVAATIIDCQGTQTQPHRGFYFHTGETETSVLKGLTITKGFIQIGGGILCDHSSPVIHKCVIRNNTATDESFFTQGGGGILCRESLVLISNCEVDGNTGGGICIDKGSPVVNNCSIIANDSSLSGGGVRFYHTSAKLLNSKLVVNRAESGGAVACYQDRPLISGCYISGNIAYNVVGSGGGVFSHRSNLNIEFTVIAGNSSFGVGGGARFMECQAEISNCTIVGNRADKRGGGIFYDEDAHVTLSNSIIRDNSASAASQMGYPQYPDDDFTQRVIYVSYSNIQGGKEAVEGWGNTHWQDGNIDTDPLFAIPGNWNGDTWIDGDYHLKSHAGRYNPVTETWILDEEHSPSIDAGDTQSDYTNEPLYNGQRSNIGTYANTQHASKTPNCTAYPTGDLNKDCKVTLADLAIMTTNWLTCNLQPQTACN